MTNIQTIPLAQLRLSPRNVRKTGSTAVDELAASIAAEGVLNNLVVTAANDGFFDVEDGGRRLQALQLLATNGRLTDALASVPCHVVESERGTEAGLTANLMRQAMHPADEFLAFQQLVTEGKAIDEIAVRFGKTAR
ncbi:MAG TPA: ParB/Srx family N-terminal domain-containing protein, partial [Pseudoxanthomonas mexicana]|nr:ParB/Srx family N-terminal domain-containing protein [Pseudoxanthomonas mexicana]